MSLSVKLPLMFSDATLYQMNTNMQDLIKQNLKMLLLTMPGERVMIPDYGVGLKKFLFEPLTTDTETLMINSIKEQVEKYMPYVTITNLEVLPSHTNPNLLTIIFTYYVRGLNLEQILEVTI